jgi:predicted GNAT family N-acyltransferase
LQETEFVITTWGVDRPLLQAIRRQVFILEQNVPEEEEWDSDDEVSVHVLATRKREPVGTGRLSPAGKIGRLAVLTEFRGQGIGRRILEMLVEQAYRQDLVQVYLHAQVQALPFYEKAGFRGEGRIFDEAGIPHRRMCKALG